MAKTGLVDTVTPVKINKRNRGGGATPTHYHDTGLSRERGDKGFLKKNGLASWLSNGLDLTGDMVGPEVIRRDSPDPASLTPHVKTIMRPSHYLAQTL